MDHAAFRILISGEARGPWPSACRAALQGASWVYGAAVGSRNRAFDLGWKRGERVPVPVVSIGNLTTGGTGKTPFAAFTAQWFQERGVRVCFLSRGYGAQAGDLNDEALVLRQHCPDVPHLQRPDRVASARQAHEELKSELLILDDGFQHRRLARDLDIVLIDAVNPWGYGRLLPRGLLREPVTALRRADLAVITRVDQVAPETVQAVRDRVAAIHPLLEIVEVAFPPQSLVNARGVTEPLESRRGQPVAAFCGIGNPQAFRESLEWIGTQVVALRAFPDHHAYTEKDFAELLECPAASNAAAFVTTEKDLVKIQRDRIGEKPLCAVQIGTRIVRGEESLEDRLQSLLAHVSRSNNVSPP